MDPKTGANYAGEVFAANRAVGRVTLAVKAAAGTTRRARVHEEGLLRVRFPTSTSGALEAVLVNTAGGLAGGDRFGIDISAGEESRLIVTTAAAEKIYRTLAPDTSIDVRLAVGAGAALAWLPQETIMFDGARLTRRVEVELAATARLVLAEAMVFGRSGMGETLMHGHLSDRWLVRQGGRLLHAESINLDGTISEKLAQPAITGGAVAIATVLIIPGDEATISPIRALARQFRGEVGASAWNGRALVRLCAADGAALRQDLVAALTTIEGIALPRLWLN